MYTKPKPKLCDWCEKEAPHRWFGGWWICHPCDTDFFSRNGRAEKVYEWASHCARWSTYQSITKALKYIGRKERKR